MNNAYTEYKIQKMRHEEFIELAEREMLAKALKPRSQSFFHRILASVGIKNGSRTQPDFSPRVLRNMA